MNIITDTLQRITHGRILQEKKRLALEEVLPVLEHLTHEGNKVTATVTTRPLGMMGLLFQKRQTVEGLTALYSITERFLDEVKKRGDGWYGEATYEAYQGKIDQTHYLKLREGITEKNMWGEEVRRRTLNKANIRIEVHYRKETHH